jgi:predicted nucleotidyltransferase
VNELKGRTDVLASWEIGSVANGTADQFSDTDLLALVEGSTDEIFQVVEAILESHSGIAHRWIEPQPPRPGQWQRVYILNDAPKHYFFDFGVVSRASKETLLELLKSERHGAPVVHFDKIGAIKPTPIDSGSGDTRIWGHHT